MPAGFFWLPAAQFLSGLADHAVLIVAIAYLQEQRHPLIRAGPAPWRRGG